MIAGLRLKEFKDLKINPMHYVLCSMRNRVTIE